MSKYTHAVLASRFERARDKTKGYLLATHTRVVKDGENYAIRYHDTNVITVSPDGTTTLNSGGWRSKTTKERINEFAIMGTVTQSKGVWYLHTHGETVVFADGIQIAPDGTVTGGLPLDEVKKEAKLRKGIIKYAKEYSRKLHAGEIVAPSNGDCWACLMGLPHTDHIQQHIEESYYVPSLVLRALKDMGASQIDRHNAQCYLKIEGSENHTPFKHSHSEQDIANYIKRFCLKECGLPY